ncbi:unnamed protein product [Nezara viridula]|uniref:Uncharacterized protein n=1 Tax=Nezara viridula TaxID=85310 RepID=A0A9P0E5Z3_NEZVI|nr:unnamed protein product [Nezara viridula]
MLIRFPLLNVEHNGSIINPTRRLILGLTRQQFPLCNRRTPQRRMPLMYHACLSRITSLDLRKAQSHE